MADKCVVRNVAYTRAKVGNMERHNERKNEHYGNGDVQLDQSSLNVHFKECESGYLQAFDKLIEDGVISTRGLKKDAKIIDEMKSKPSIAMLLKNPNDINMAVSAITAALTAATTAKLDEIESLFTIG